MKKSNQYIEFIIKGIYAGVMIGIGGIAYLAIPNKIVGSFIFSIGLLTVCMYSLNLYTGKVGYILVNKINYIFEVLFSLIGNFIGTFLVGNLIRITRYGDYIETARNIVNIKLADNIISIFILSIFCGIIMYIAVNNYKKETSDLGKYIIIVMGVMAFILSGFEHCVANMFYFSVAGIWNIKVFLYLAVMILGNGLGSIIIAFCYNKFNQKYLLEDKKSTNKILPSNDVCEGVEID